MGNCIKPNDPLADSIPRGITVDATPIKQSGLPIIFVIGGPGIGKRAVCLKVAQRYGFLSIITADIIRNEVSKRNERAFALARLLSQGRLVPSDILVELITVRMLDHIKEKRGFVVSGFPREKSQCKLFDKEVKPPDLVVYLEVRNSVMSDRIMARNVRETSRPTISYDYIKHVIKEFHKRNKPVIKYYKKNLVTIDGEFDVTTIVYENVCKAIDSALVNHVIYHSNTNPSGTSH